MNIKRLLYSKYSKYFIAIILGIGITTLFRKTCDEKNCLEFKRPGDISKKVFKFDNRCYRFKQQDQQCSNSKTIVT